MSRTELIKILNIVWVVFRHIMQKSNIYLYNSFHVLPYLLLHYSVSIQKIQKGLPFNTKIPTVNLLFLSWSSSHAENFRLTFDLKATHLETQMCSAHTADGLPQYCKNESCQLHVLSLCNQSPLRSYRCGSVSKEWHWSLPLNRWSDWNGSSKQLPSLYWKDLPIAKQFPMTHQKVMGNANRYQHFPKNWQKLKLTIL